jgi:hypothetical protein
VVLHPKTKRSEVAGRCWSVTIGPGRVAQTSDPR